MTMSCDWNFQAKPPVLAGGSTVNSSLQNKSWSRIPVNLGRATPRPAWPLTRSHSGQRSSGWGDSQSESQPGLHWQGVFRNLLVLSSSVSCRANMGITEIQVDVLTSDVMAGARARGAAGPAPDVRHQPEGTVRRECRFQRLYTLYYPWIPPRNARW